MLKDFTITFGNFGSDVYIIREVEDLQTALEILCSNIENAMVYMPESQLDYDDYEELENMGWIYIDSTEYGGETGYLDVCYMAVSEKESEVK